MVPLLSKRWSNIYHVNVQCQPKCSSFPKRNLLSSDDLNMALSILVMSLKWGSVFLSFCSSHSASKLPSASPGTLEAAIKIKVCAPQKGHG